METKNMIQEQISALLDSELSDAHIDVALAALRQNDGRATWDVYHQIGDVLRSEDMAHEFSDGFAARMMARLDQEPPILAPPLRQTDKGTPGRAALAAGSTPPLLKRYAFPTALAAATVLALVFVPQMVKTPKSDTMAPVMVVAPGQPQPGTGGTLLTSTGQQQDGTMVRDPRISQYLLAHQRFSPSWNSTAQYARSATYTVTSDSDK